MSRKYRPCPKKLALAHDYDKQRCEEILKLCWKQGAGLNMFYEQYLELKRIVLEICYDQSLNLPFKREVKEVDLILDTEDTYTDLQCC